ncbi:molybdopterin dehydrogenase [Polynucleobacter paneuropaeus]|jgi:CO/xanthine dehydrogenase FAD-binding subunit|nr:molybdopterin dehydrogenase [Polynucleobacter paneuropaeus]
MLTYKHYIVAKTLDELFDILDANPASRILAGATDILPWARYGRAGDVHLNSVIDISKIDELSYIKIDDGVLHFGANTTISKLQNDPILRRHAPILSRCAVWFADDQIREQATVAGNIVNASPAGDTQPALLALNAKVILIRREQKKIIKRSVLLSDFIEGPSKTNLLPNEIVLGFECDSVPDYGYSYEKVGHRRSLVISTVCLAVLTKLSADKKILTDVRIGIGAVGPKPQRLVSLEKSLVGGAITNDFVRRVSEEAGQYVQSRSRQEYRREVLVNFIERSIINSVNQAGLSLERYGEEQICG